MVESVGRTMVSDAAGACKLPLLEALLAEHRTALSWTERNRSFLTACRARRLCLDSFARSWARAGPVCPLGLAGLAPFGLVLELLVGEEQLFASCPDKLRPAVNTP